MLHYILTVTSLLVLANLVGCKTTDLSGQNPIRDGQRVKPTTPPSAATPSTYTPTNPNAPRPYQPNPGTYQPTSPNKVNVGVVGNPIYFPPAPVTPTPNFPVIKWEQPSINMDPNKGSAPDQMPPQMPPQTPSQTQLPPITAEPPPPATLTEACRPDVLAANSAIVLQGQTFAASARASTLRGVKTTVSAFTSIVVTLDNGKTYSSNNIFAAIVRNGKTDFNVRRGYSESGTAWYEVGGYGGVFGQITYSGNSAILNLVNGACVVQYGAANGGYPYLVLP